MSFHNTKVVITGATSGIGRASAQHFARLGAEVVITGRDAERGHAVVAEIEASGGRASFVAADLSQPAEVLALVETVGDVDVLVNNAAAWTFSGTVATSADLLREILEVNVVAAFVLVAALAPRMAARGRGAIVNVSSLAGQEGSPTTPAYGASKSALDLLTKGWALEFGPAGVRVNSVSPGPVRTPPAEIMGAAFDQIAAGTPLGRAASPEEIAAVIVFLASEQASYVNGAIVPVDAGMAAG